MPDEPYYVKLEQEKVAYDADKERRQQELLTANRVIIKGIDIPFWDLGRLLVKIALAMIPATIIVIILWIIIIGVLKNVFRPF